MKVKTKQDLLKQGRVTKGEGFTSYRYLLQSDNMGFTVCRTEIPVGGPYNWHYLHHKEACLCISGLGTVKQKNGYEILIKPGDMYILDAHQDHYFVAIEDTVLISVFNPPLIGNEVHDENRSYPENPYVFENAKKIFAIANNEGKQDSINKIKDLLI